MYTRTWLNDCWHIKDNDLSQFAGPGKRVVLLPEEWQSGTLIYPYTEALK